MRICNRVASVIFLGFVAIATTGAQSSTKKTDEAQNPPSVTMPEMPSVSMPSVGSSIYAPGRSDFYNPNLNRKQNQSKTQTSSQTDSANFQTNANASQTAGANQSPAQSTNLLQAQNLNSLANSASSSLNQLTADDISSMNNLGIFSQISGLLGRGNMNLQSQLLANQNTVTASTVDSATLQQILSELTELKHQMSGSGAGGEKAPSVSEQSAGKSAFTNTAKKEPKILRFVVNGYDMLSTCKKIYFSDLETDGTFLLTGDRTYLSEGKARAETFYFYFHTSGSENGITKYAVTPAVSQDYENEYSYLYQLTQKSTLTANRTGNLVTLRVADGGWNMDLLISLDR